MTENTGRWVGPELVRRRRVICIGNFDGVHRGHQALVQRGLALAEDVGATNLTALSFWPPPSRYFRPESTLELLSLPDERVRLLMDAGVGEPLFLPFDEGIALLPAETFVAEVLVEQLQAAGVVVGADFRFGTNRRGDTELLRSILEENGAVLDVVAKVESGDKAISSSRIRRLIAEGPFDKAIALLGHGYPLSGRVVPGDQRGRQIGFPTANIDIHSDKLRPKPGVYGGFATGASFRLPAVVNVGTKPTFVNDGGLVIEAHLVGAPEALDLYGETMNLSLHFHLRDERRFASVAALTAQITRDIEALQRRLA
ncbi:MAG: riboflavin biosynthesis protein RibF [Myxococcales bacterium]|nr:riboflavin biosynthesis protein RibF [Myxococcales bacterium]